MNNNDIIRKLTETGTQVSVKVQVNDALIDIKDVIWLGFENEGCYKIVIKDKEE